MSQPDPNLAYLIKKYAGILAAPHYVYLTKTNICIHLLHRFDEYSIVVNYGLQRPVVSALLHTATVNNRPLLWKLFPTVESNRLWASWWFKTPPPSQGGLQHSAGGYSAVMIGWRYIIPYSYIYIDICIYICECGACLIMAWVFHYSNLGGHRGGGRMT